MRNLLTPLLYICVGALLSMMLMRSCNPKEIPTEIIKTDTLTIVKVDTVRIVQPQAVKIMRDTVKITDTILIAGQTFFQEVKEYRDSTYYARVSGINAFLEEIRVYPRTITKYITTIEKEVQKPKKWGLVASAEYGYMGGRSYLPVGVKLRYMDSRRTYFVKGGKDVINGIDFVAAGAELDILRW
ncbi:MAG: hypothetical protein J6A27_08275 [Bacteroidales bacterium]|nr:hypothetical protein [Bacteroidales bacterium]